MKLRFTAEAYHSNEVIGTWWCANRDRSPDLFLDEIFRVVALLESAPKMGEFYRRGAPVIVWGTPLRDPLNV